MARASEESYEEMIAALQKFTAEVEEECDVMRSAGEDCVDNTEEDPAAVSCNERLTECIGRIGGVVENIQGIISALQTELEQIREAARKAQQYD